MKRITIVAAVIATFAGAGFSGYLIGAHSQDGQLQPSAATAEAGRKVLYWQDPMVPGARFEKPGKSPFMDMQLVPVYADETQDTGAIEISPRQTQNLGLRTAEVVKGSLAPRVEATGTVAWNERGLVVVQARNTGFVEKLHVRATLDRVGRGQALADIYVPDWVAAQEEYLAVRAMHGEGVGALADAARIRMRQAGMTEGLIAQVEKSGAVQARVTISAPVGGSLVELGVREGMTVMPGATLFRINSTDTVWVNAQVPEGQAALVQPGAAIEAGAAGFPGQVFKGRVQAILPEVDATTRTLKVRIELPNPDGRLAPGMYVRIALGAPPSTGLLLPAEALIHTGTRSVVMLDEGSGKYRPVEVKPGQEYDGRVEILEGLKAGQKVVISGQFLLDSEASLRAVATRVAEPRAAWPKTYEIDAVFEGLDGSTAMISHPPIPELKWQAMTMGFGVPAGGWPKNIAPGQKIHMAFMLQEGAEPLITTVTAVAGGSK